ncbi:MAG: flotillin domain-containing protein, partial [Pseudomonadota bacterium]
NPQVFAKDFLDLFKKLAEVIATSKKERAEIDAEAGVAVRRAAMEAERLKLKIDQDEQQAAIAQRQEIATLQAAQEAEIARRQEEAEQEKEQARIKREEAIRAADIARERAIRDAEISRDRELEVADQDRQIIVAKKSEEESHARASADTARAEATKAEEAVETARSVAMAERQKQIALIEAQREAERAATRIKVEATAEKDAAQDRAEAVREEAQAEADSLSIRAEAKKTDLLAEAEGRRAIVEAENAITEEIVNMKVALARLEKLPEIVAEMVKPAEKIDTIRIHQVSGLGQGVTGGVGGGDKPPVNQALDSIMGMAVQLPALKKIGEDLGVSMDNGVAGLVDELTSDKAANEDDEVETKQLPAAE